jgi:hypothetical protein
MMLVVRRRPSAQLSPNSRLGPFPQKHSKIKGSTEYICGRPFAQARRLQYGTHTVYQECQVEGGLGTDEMVHQQEIETKYVSTKFMRSPKFMRKVYFDPLQLKRQGSSENYFI